MSYSARLKRWAVVRLLPNLQRTVVERFYKRSDADGFAQALRRILPTAEIIVIFDPPQNEDANS